MRCLDSFEIDLVAGGLSDPAESDALSAQEIIDFLDRLFKESNSPGGGRPIVGPTTTTPVGPQLSLGGDVSVGGATINTPMGTGYGFGIEIEL